MRSCVTACIYPSDRDTTLQKRISHGNDDITSFLHHTGTPAPPADNAPETPSLHFPSGFARHLHILPHGGNCLQHLPSTAGKGHTLSRECGHNHQPGERPHLYPLGRIQTARGPWPYADHFRVSWAVRKYPGYLSYLEDMDKVKELKCPKDGRSSSSSQPSHQTSQSIKTRTGSEVVRGHRMNLTKHGIAAFPSPLQLEATGRTEESIDIRIKSPHGVSEAVYCVSACTTVYIEYEDKENTSEETQCSEYRESATARYPEGNFHIKFVRDDGHTAEWTGADVYSDTGLHPDTLYRYEATACNNLGCSRARDVAGITEVAGETDLPNPPAYVRGKEVRGDVEISWSHVKGATYYKVNDNVESPQSHSPYYPHVSAPLTSYIDSSPNRTYTGLSFISGDLLPTTYSVKACNKTGCSESSPTFTIR